MMTSALISRKWGVLLVGITLVSLGVSACGRDEATQAAQQLIAVRVTTPVFTDLTESISYVGTVRGRQEIRVNARAPGTVADLPLTEGASVSAGQLVATISAPELTASVDRVQADREYWCQRNETDERLVQADALPAEQADVSRRACRSASAALAEAEAQLAKTRELAPVSGRILSRLVEPGQHVLPGQGLVLIGSHGLELRVEVIGEDLRRGIDVGTSASVHTSDGGILRSKVSEIASVATGSARTFTVTVSLPESRGRDLRIGASMAVDFDLASCSECIAVPSEALHRINNRTYLFMIREGRALLEPVEPGIKQGGLVQVSFDWNGSDRVAISNLESLADGIAVFAVEAGGDSR